MSAHAGRGIGNAIARDLRRAGHVRTELNGPSWAPDDGRVWVSPAYRIWAEIFELGERVAEVIR